MSLREQKLVAHREYKKAKAAWEADQQPLTMQKMLRAKKKWKEAIARYRASMDKKKKTVHEKRLGLRDLDYPEPANFEILMMHKQWWRAVVDPSWNPPRSQCRMLGRYVFGTLGDKAVSTQAIMIVKGQNGESTMDMRTKVAAFFDREDVRIHFGRCRIVQLERSSKPRHRSEFFLRFTTNHDKIKGFIREENT